MGFRSASVAGVVVLLLASPQAAEAGKAEAAVTGPWARAELPSPGVAGAIGSPSSGCLAGGQALAPEGEGYQVLRVARSRFYGHPLLVAFVRDLAARARAEGLPGLLIGDMAQPRGGPMAFGHGSHQTGLDVDVWFRPAEVPLPPAEREAPTAVSMVRGTAIDPQAWSPVQARLLELTARSPEVDRIFVNPVIKVEMCRSAASVDRAWLAKLRPWWGHDSHFHVRLSCPPGEPACLPQRPVPDGDGCGAELASWFARSTVPVPADRPNSRHPLLPAACAAVLGK